MLYFSKAGSSGTGARQIALDIVTQMRGNRLQGGPVQPLEAVLVSKQVFFLLAAIVLALGCNRGNPTAPAGRTGGQGFFASRVSVQGPNAELLAQAQDALRNGDQQGAIEALRELIKADPKNRHALFFMANVLQDQGMALAHGREAKSGYALFQESAKYMRQLRAECPQLNERERELLARALYNDACALALDGQAKKALTVLEEAIDAGFNELHLMADDEDLKTLRELPKFKELLGRLRPM